MFTIKKIFDREWYFRKYISCISKVSRPEKVELRKLEHLIKRQYLYTFGKPLNLKSPKSLNEKLIWLSLFWRDPLKSECADKFKMRAYVTGSIGLSPDLLVPLLGVWTTPEDLDFSALPDSFVLKCNHGCGYNIIVRDKHEINYNDVKRKLSEWLSQSYHGAMTEFHYNLISPRVILCEDYLPSLGSGSVIDYKIHCFNGNPNFVLVCYDRDENEVAKLATFDFEWHQLFYVVDEIPVNIEKPQSLTLMIEYAKKLSSQFPFVRVDFYDVEGKPLLGELTFTPYGNMIDYYKPEILDALGNKLLLPSKVL
mgnify:CR=1 FL=1